LVVEDREAHARAFCKLVELVGGEPVHVENGKEALDRLEREGFRLVLLDLYMPVMGGLEFLQHYAEKRRQAPVLVLSAYLREPAAVERLKQLGHPRDRIFDKLHLDELETRLRELLADA